MMSRISDHSVKNKNGKSIYSIPETDTTNIVLYIQTILR